MQWGSQDLRGLNITLQSSDKQRLKKNRKNAELKKTLANIFTGSLTDAERMHRGDSEEQGKGSSSKAGREETGGTPPHADQHTHTTGTSWSSPSAYTDQYGKMAKKTL